MSTTLRWGGLAVAVLLSSSSAPARAECGGDELWPTDEWPSRVAEVASKKAAEIKALEEYAFTLTGADEERKGIRTDGVVVIHKGKLIYEKYARGWDAGKKHLAWSASKSITSALAGIATAEAGLDLDKSICEWLTPARPEHCAVTPRHLLWMSSGISWKEVYENESNQVSSVLAMLYGEGNGDIPAFVLGHERRAPPGESWEYASGETNVLAAIVEKAFTKAGQNEDWPWTKLFDRIGMKRVTFETDRAGHYVGSSYAYATPREFAKFGYLYLNKGCWAGQRVLPEGWVDASVEVAPPFKKEPLGRDPDDVYGMQWWLNRPVPEQAITTPWPGVPEDAYAARGHWGQSLTVIPSLHLVVVRFADDREKSFKLADFLTRAIALVDG